jgi:DNA mismatch repair protein MutS
MSADGLTPMMRQYFDVKAQYPDKIVFFRMGDFYEMFGDDAREAAPILGIALTSRSTEKEKKVPLCGVPYHAIDKYLPRLIDAGKKVVICEQVEDAKEAKGLVKREVVEIVTPGTITAEDSLSPLRDNYLVALCGDSKSMGLACLELSTGEFTVVEDHPDTIFDFARTAAPRELLFPADNKTLIDPLLNGSVNGIHQTPLEQIYFDARLAGERLCRFFETTTLDGYGLAGLKKGVAAAGAVLRYLADNKQTRLDHIKTIKVARTDDRMLLDASTIRNLEMFVSQGGDGEKYSLFWAVNRTASAAGARRLRRALAAPYTDKERINKRLEAIDELLQNGQLSRSLHDAFSELPDLERLCGRIGMGRANPRTMLAVRDSITLARNITASLRECHAPLMHSIAATLPDLHDLAEKINSAVKPDAPFAVSGGGIFNSGYSAKLDELNASIKGAREYIATLAKVEKDKTGIPSLKVGFNKVFGYYIEVTRTHSKQVPERYIRKQTLVNAERYITEEMKEKESLIIAAEEKINALEQQLFDKFANEVAERLPDLMAAADLLAETDLVNGFARLAADQGYVRPRITDTRELRIIQGKHPVISQILGPGEFVANDIILDETDCSMIILTGPNMSGKSTWLRQAGLIVLLAQSGSFVPAREAEIGIVDRVFTRVGAADKLTRGQSTFLVEMVETANILNNMTERSLILLDEVGRGTSTFDGLSVAWSIGEAIYKHEPGTPRTLFATHYHEMTGLAGIYPRIENFQVLVRKWKSEVIFLHQIEPGGCDDSYGIEVARLAGLPKETIRRAKEILRLLESGEFAKSELARGVHVKLNQPSLFDAVQSEVEKRLHEIDIDKLTPLEALKLLAELKHAATDD